ncbi:hypothetical protein EG68_07340 [Paragonimus skrjabini miyazakii]|uniref:Uncharacterized protein n=1 Tax=Paragonimus skrjabini miyazakii TaxID=59628 RepID=A0A8S9YUI8_9TREM|nr:hypothetical protein EG68_07340 [Paragonimus skrjabini miyazakii]
MSQQPVSRPPMCCLFESLENKPLGVLDLHLRRMERLAEASKACQRSVERLRRVYSFDVKSLCPSKNIQQNRASSGTTKGNDIFLTDKRLSVSCCLLPHQCDAQQWFWEAVSLQNEYIPPFYHSVRYHSDSCLKQHEVPEIPRPPPTPNKMDKTERQILSQVNHRKIENKLDRNRNDKKLNIPLNKENDFIQPLVMPTLFRVWRARIRRASYTESCRESVSFKNTCNQSDNELECTKQANASACSLNERLLGGTIRVPYNSPAKQPSFTTPMGHHSHDRVPLCTSVTPPIAGKTKADLPYVLPRGKSLTKMRQLKLEDTPIQLFGTKFNYYPLFDDATMHVRYQ